MTPASLLPTIEPQERVRFFLAALAFMCIATSALVARAMGDSLFLSSLGSSALPFMYVAGALVTGLGSYACARAAPRVATVRLAILVATVLLAGNLAVFLTLDALPVTARATAYLLADVTARVLMVLYWATVSEVFDARESRRLLGLIGAVGTAACLPTGFLVGPVARRFGVPSLLFVTTALLIGFILFIRLLSRRHRKERGGSDERRAAPPNRLSTGQLHRRRQFVTIAALAVITSLVQVLVDYHFKTSFSATLSGAALAAVFGQLYAHASLVALVLQLFLVHRILRWGGVLISLSALPLGLMAASAVVLQTASASWTYITKALDITLTLTVNGTGRQMLYRGIPSESRVQARTLAEGLYQPVAMAIAGTVLALTVDSLTVRTMAAMTIGGCVVWLLMARSAYASYVSGLISSLRAARFASEDEAYVANEPAVKKYVLSAIESAPGEQVKYLAAVLPSVLLKGNQTDAEVRWTIVRSAAAGEFPASEAWLRAKLSDPHPRVRAFAAAGLINLGLPSGAKEARAALEQLACSDTPADRLAAAEGIGETRGGSFTPLLEHLLRSEEEEVLEAVLDATLAHPAATLIAGVLPLLSRNRLAADASDALVVIGAASIGPVARYVRSTPRSGRAALVKKLARAMARHRRTETLPLFRGMMRIIGADDRAAVLQAYLDLLRLRALSDEDLQNLESLIAAEARAAMEHVTMLGGLPLSPSTVLLRLVLTHLVKCHARNAFMLLDARVDEVNMMALHATFSSGSRESRSQVIELLHNVVPEKLQSPLLEVLAGAELEPFDEFTDPRLAIADVLEQRRSEWITAGALHAATHLPITARRRQLRVLLEDPNPVVRETALSALARVERRATLVGRCLPLITDADPNVRQLARSLVEQEGSNPAC